MNKICTSCGDREEPPEAPAIARRWDLWGCRGNLRRWLEAKVPEPEELSAEEQARSRDSEQSFFALRMIMSCLHNDHHYLQNEETGSICIEIVQYRGVPVTS